MTTQSPDKKEQIEVKAPLLSRALSVGTGLGITASHAPMVSRYLKGADTLWHGTGMGSGQRILSDKFDSSYAGSGVTSDAEDRKTSRAIIKARSKHDAAENLIKEKQRIAREEYDKAYAAYIKNVRGNAHPRYPSGIKDPFHEKLRLKFNIPEDRYSVYGEQNAIADAIRNHPKYSPSTKKILLARLTGYGHVAGENEVKKARINRYLMSNALNKELEDAGVELRGPEKLKTHFEEMLSDPNISAYQKLEIQDYLRAHGAGAGDATKNSEKFNDLMNNRLRTVKADEAANAVTNRMLHYHSPPHPDSLKPAEYEQLSKNVGGDYRQWYGKAKRLTPEEAKAVAARVKENLPNYGRRLYFAAHPADVVEWSTGKNEIDIMADRVVDMAKKAKDTDPLEAVGKGLGRTFGDLFTGGMITTHQQGAARRAYKPTSVTNMTRAEAINHLNDIAKVNPNQRLSFGVHMPTGGTSYLRDFPGFRHAVALNPGFKHTMSMFLPNYDPSRDISVAHDVDAKHIHTIDLIDDEAKAIKRINITDAVKSAKSPFSHRVKGALLPAAMTLGGLGLMYRGLKGSSRMVDKNSMAGKREQRQREQLQNFKNRFPSIFGQKKTASFALRDTARAMKTPLGLAALGTAAGLGGVKAMNMLMPDNPTDSKFQQSVKDVAQGAGGSLLGLAAVTAGIRKKLDFLPKKIRTSAAIALAMPATALTTTPAVAGYQKGKGDPGMFASFLPKKAQDWVAEHPIVSGAIGGMTIPALMAGSYYGLRRYYPSAIEAAGLTPAGVRHKMEMTRKALKEADDAGML